MTLSNEVYSKDRILSVIREIFAENFVVPDVRKCTFEERQQEGPCDDNRWGKQFQGHSGNPPIRTATFAPALQQSKNSFHPGPPEACAGARPSRINDTCDRREHQEPGTKSPARGPPR